MKYFTLLLLTSLLLSCGSEQEKTDSSLSSSEIKMAGAMKDVMWKGKLGSSIDIDTITEKQGLYGLGPEALLRGEVLIMDGKSYVSRVESDSTMIVENTDTISAPFLVYGYVHNWDEIDVPEEVTSVKDLEQFINETSQDKKRPFAFKLSGTIENGVIHIQNLPKGTEVSSPQEAHQGQTDYELGKEKVDIVGFFSTEHQGIFTHHDSYVHMHLITEDRSKMGHLDNVSLDKMKLYLPK